MTVPPATKLAQLVRMGDWSQVSDEECAGWLHDNGDAVIDLIRAAQELDGITPFKPEWYRARFVLRAALARLGDT